MSDPTADPAGAGGDASGPPRESAAGVIGVGVGLLLIAGLVLLVARQHARPADGSELLAASFAVGALPFGLTVEGGAVLAGGERVVALAVPGASEPERAVPAEEDGGGGDEASAVEERSDEASEAGGPAHKPYDWTGLAVGEPGTPPLRVFLVCYPASAAKGAIDRQFRDVFWQDLRDFGAGGGRMMTDQGTLEWAEYEAGYVIERELERGGTFCDWMRVNLSLEDRACVLIARWARGSPAAKERVEELCAALQPRAAPGGGGGG